MTGKRLINSPLFSVLSILALFSGTGCTAISPPGLGLLDELLGSPPGAEAAPSNDGLVCTVEIRTSGRKTRKFEAPFRDGMFLQDLVQQSGVAKRFRRMEIDVFRGRPDGPGFARMRSAFDHAKRRVDPACDYALHPGDHVIITEKNKFAIDEVVGESLGPFGPLLGV